MMNFRRYNSLVCDCCGRSFASEYYHGGSIDHDNYTNTMRMNNFLFNFLEADEQKKYELFLDSIMLSGNFCNIKNNFLKVGLQVFECRLMWLKERGYDDIVKYLEDNRPNIPIEYAKIKDELIAEKQKEIEMIKAR